MPIPQGADAGLIFLQHVIEYAETVLFPNGCSCGATADFTIEAEMHTLPNGQREPRAYIIECLSCHCRTAVPADVLESFSAAAYQGGQQPGQPPPQADCEVCGATVAKYTLALAGNGLLQCAACATVTAKIGDITEVTKEDRLLG
jgi:hypothetical protein